MGVVICPARAEDVPAIDALLRASFPDASEAGLVRALCFEGDMILVLAAFDDDALVGMVAFSRMDVGIGGKAIPAVALAPVAVARDQRRAGVAEALIQTGLERLEDEGVVLCFVLGDPAYYRRFGFDAAWARNFASPYAGDHFMALPLQGGLMPCGEREAASHAAAFARLGAA